MSYRDIRNRIKYFFNIELNYFQYLSQKETLIM